MEHNTTLINNGNFIWNWTDFCPTGLKPWLANSNDLQPCFQEIIFHLPTYTIFAAISSFHFGSIYRSVSRNKTQINLIYTRVAISIVLSLLPILKIFYNQSKQIHIYPVDVLLSCSGSVMWAVHAGYLLSIRKQGDLNHRGPLIINVIWTTIFVLDCIWLRTSLRYTYWPWSLLTVLLDCIYLLSLIPNGMAHPVRTRIIQNDEEVSLLSNRYVHFNVNFNEIFLGHAQDEANIASKSIFYWVEPLISKGVSGNLKKIEDLFDLPDCLNILRNSERLQLAIFRTKSLVGALHKAFGTEFYLIGLLRFMADVAGFAGPLLLGGLLSESNINGEYVGTDSKPYFYALGLFLSTLISAFCSTHFNWRIAIVGMKMRTAIVSAIYRKALEAESIKNSKSEILNLMSTDTDRIVNSCVSFHTFWSIPLQLFTTLYLLYTQIGAAFIAGVCFAAALIPVNRWLAVKIQKYSEGLMSSKDARLSATSETIIGAKQIKMHAWEDIFIDKIKNCRSHELEFLSKRKYLDALCVYFWATTPVLMCLLTFGVSVLMGNPLTAATTYTSVALLNMLIGPLNAFPWVLNGLVEAWVSIKRVQKLINLTNLDFSSYYDPIIEYRSDSIDLTKSVLQLQEATFQYDSADSCGENNYVFKLEKVDMDVKKGDLICIHGPVGSGKSTLINAIIASINCTEGYVRVHDFNSGFGYVSQNTWLQRGTIKENIIWGSVFDELRYTNVIYSCALKEDIENLGGDHIGIGEGGRTLSGGQRMRISLARAVYQDKKIYLFDDVLASVDAHVANHIVKYCILGILKDKTRIAVTENKTLFFNANQILNVQDGTVTKSSLMSESFDLSDDGFDELGLESTRRLSTIHLNDLRNNNNIDDDGDEDKKSLDSIMLEENKEQGNLNTNVLRTYWQAMTGPLSFLVILFVLLMQFSRNMSDAWLAHWVAETNPTNSSSSNSTNETGFEIINDINNTNKIDDYFTGYYLGIYAFLAVLNSIITLIRSFLFAYAGIKAATFIHDKLLNRVIYTKFSFFDITSAGRILNRFSSDTYTVDDSLPFILNILLAQSVGLAGAILITLYAMPWLSLIVIPLVPIYVNLQYRYRYASRDIKRLSSNALSPIYAHFTETLQGLETIRAMRASPRFQRDFLVKLEESIKAQLTSCAAQQWLSLRLQFLGSLLVGGAGLLAAITSAHATTPSLVGLAISYALSITGLLGGVLNAFAETEQEMIAVERIDQYLQLDEEDNVNGSLDSPFGWPSQGSVNFKDVYFKYRDHLSPALVNFNLKSEAFERIAIVGRTGAGKSSILNALLRIAPLLSGEISVDCVNLKLLSLKHLRDRIVIIPQEPFLFEGSVRDNLDPRRKYIDSEIWNAITNCLATPLIQNLGGLNGRLGKGGKNLSAGQRQLLCLTRALLKSSKVICIDEGTSNLDSDSEAAIQIVLRNSFKNSTIFLIAHRLKGLQNMDRIIVMDNGHIVEQGPPKELADNQNSLFSKMLQEQRNKDFNLN